VELFFLSFMGWSAFELFYGTAKGSHKTSRIKISYIMHKHHNQQLNTSDNKFPLKKLSENSLIINHKNDLL
jgi:hypothetical protein